MGSSTRPQHRPSQAVVDLDALRSNVARLADRASPAKLCAVVKADAYGHGAVPCARAALEAGAATLGVALVEEARDLRAASIEAPVLLLSEPPPGSEAAVVDLDIEPTVYTETAISALDVAASAAGRTLRVHLKVDTGMRRVGAELEDAVELAKQITASPNLHLHATWTHFAVADEPDDPFTDEQAAAFDAVLDAIGAAGIDPGLRHAGNSAALIRDPDRFAYDMVRTGIAVYGIPPARALEGALPLRPALSFRSRVSYVRPVPAETRVSYGLRYATAGPGWLGTVPLGYADGVRRNLSGRVHVLVGGRRYPVAGTITMDQFMIDFGSDRHDAGDEVVVIGRQGEEVITALDWADVLGTIGYEVTCGIGARVPRHYVGGAAWD